jgi:hypothetical protein
MSLLSKRFVLEWHYLFVLISRAHLEWEWICKQVQYERELDRTREWQGQV